MHHVCTRYRIALEAITRLDVNEIMDVLESPKFAVGDGVLIRLSYQVFTK